mmetsp:Transcript_52334/g.117855  ORF Transcript_52334/g.117855 Transcript_52334/m.117855 type:complete len:512 (+) Transcript_52334:164-1699(+)
MRDEWNRQTTGGRLGMLIVPFTKLAMVAGIALSVATAGGATLASVAADIIIAESVGTMFAYKSLADMFISKLIATPLSCAQGLASDMASANSAGFKRIQKLWSKFDESEVIQDVRFQLQQELDKLMQNPEIEAIIESFGDDGSSEEVEEIARRHFGEVIASAFTQELSPSLYEEIQHRERKKSAEFGWLSWEKWRRYRRGSKMRALKDKPIQYRGQMSPAAVGFTGIVLVNRTSWKTFGLGDQTIQVWQPGHGKLLKIQLSDELKSGLWVKDLDAFHGANEAANVGWLSWDDWLNYTPYNCRRCLKKKYIRLDPELLVGKCHLQDPCAKSITSADDAYGARVTHVSWGIFAEYKTASIQELVKVKGPQEGDARQKRCNIELSPAVVQCLQVMDPLAYEKFSADTDRRHAEEIFHGTRNRTHIRRSVASDVKASLEAVIMKHYAEPSRVAVEANQVVADVAGQESVEFDEEDDFEEMVAGDSTTLKDAQALQEAIDDGFKVGVEEGIVKGSR